MPTYQYKCPTCSHEFEEFQSITEDAIEKCPACGKKTQRLISGGAGLLFKGSGFYTTDYRSDSYKKDSKADSSAKAAKSDKSEKGGPSDTASKKSGPSDSKTSSKAAGSSAGGPASSGSTKSS